MRKDMPFAIARSYWMKTALSVIVVCFLWRTVGCCENSTTAEAAFQHPTLSSCVTEMIRAICGALRPSPLKRNTELINSILGLPRVLQDAGR